MTDIGMTLYVALRNGKMVGIGPPSVNSEIYFETSVLCPVHFRACFIHYVTSPPISQTYNEQSSVSFSTEFEIC